MNADRNRGSTTILVIWMLGILSMIATFLIYRSEAEWAGVVNLERRLSVRRLATEVLQERLELLIADDDKKDTREDSWFNQIGIAKLDRNGYQVIVAIEDEGSKPNINNLSADELSVFPGKTANFDILLDWIDPDNESRGEGAEKDYYLAQNPSYLPRDGLISSVKELLSLKNGPEFYQALAPYCTVYGKWNPNTLTRATFENLLLSAGFDRREAERIADDFANYRANKRFDTLEQFLEFNSVTFQTLDKLKTLFEIKGHCNINLVDPIGLKVVLKQAGCDPKIAKQLLARRAAAPFETLEEVQPYLKSDRKKIHTEDYFTVISSVFRIKLWLTQGKHRYYLETVQCRTPGDSLAAQSKMQVLSWNFLSQDDVPDLSELKKNVEEEVEEETDEPNN